MADETGFTEGLRRSVHALIHTLGATAVQLQLPAPPIAGDAGEELGMRAPEFQWKALVPVALRNGSAGTDMLVPADALEELLGVEGTAAVVASLKSIAAVRVRDRSYLTADFDAVLSRGRECMYRISLRLADAEEG